MPEELEPIVWWVSLLADPKRRGRIVAKTRLEAMVSGAERLGVGIDGVDAEVERK